MGGGSSRGRPRPDAEGAGSRRALAASNSPGRWETRKRQERALAEIFREDGERRTRIEELFWEEGERRTQIEELQVRR